MRIENEVKLDYQDVLIRPKRSTLRSRKEVSLDRTFKFLHSPKEWTGIPIMAANMDTTGTFEMAIALAKEKMICCLHKHYSVQDLEEFFLDFNEPNYVAYTLGIRDVDMEKFEKVLDKGLDKKFNFIVIDVPNAYLECFVDYVKKIREMCPEHVIIAGNVVTNEMTEEILLNGADIVKIGIGPGSVCTTRLKTGVGYPQLSATIECSDAAHGVSSKEQGCGAIISDGGIQNPAGIAKAFCGGADFVMIGSLFAGFKESGGELIEREGKQYKQYYGMSSSKAMNTHYGKVDNYRASEGRNTEIPYKGEIQGFIQDILGSLRSTGTYIGARRLKEFSRRATFLMVNRQLNTSLERYDKN